MRHVKAIGRLGVLAVGLGIGAAVSATGTASADDFQISIDGFDLFPTAGNTATAVSGMGDMAIAVGPNSQAFAEGGFGDFASAFSTGSTGALAFAGDPTANATGNNFDFASASGNDSIASAGNGTGLYPGTSSFDFASAAGGNGPGAVSEALAGNNGSDDSASAFGQNVVSSAGGSINAAAPSNFDSASVLGNLTTATTTQTQAFAVFGSNETAFTADPFGTVGSSDLAGFGNGNLTSILGDHDSAVAGGTHAFLGSNDIASVFGTGVDATAGSTATAAGNFDLAEVLFGIGPAATATGSNFLVDIIP